MNQDYGVEVYYSNKKDVRNTVFFSNGAFTYYDTGGMLFELISDDAAYLMTEKALNMIRAYPHFNNRLTRDVLEDSFNWLYCAVDDDEFPLATALFRSEFGDAIYTVSHADEAETAYRTVGEFLEACYKEYIQHVQIFALFFDALSADDSDMADDFQAELTNGFKELADDLYKEYKKKCSVRHKNGHVTVETVSITNTFQLLVFEFCRLKKEGKAVKICANCGRYFIPLHRIDTIYCPAPSPQDSSKPCSEIGPHVRRANRLNNFSFEREHHNARSRINMAAMRARNNGDEHLLAGYMRMLEQEKAKYESKKKEFSE